MFFIKCCFKYGGNVVEIGLLSWYDVGVFFYD